MVRSLAVTLGCAALYGFALGFAHDGTYALRNLAKFPLLIGATAAVCAVSFWLAARLFRVELGFAATQRCAWQLYRDTAVLLASLSPAVFFLACVLRATDDGKLGEYDLFLGINVTLIAASGTLALLRQARTLQTQPGATRGRARATVASWLALSLLVGGQASFWMRPFVGFPATRGARPPFFLMNQPDLRGATNFFEAVLQAVMRPGLPPGLREPMAPTGR